jgi:hypothetical protein
MFASCLGLVFATFLRLLLFVVDDCLIGSAMHGCGVNLQSFNLNVVEKSIG